MYPSLAAVTVRPLLLTLASLLAIQAAARADGADDVQKALDKLDAAHSYTWSTQSIGNGGYSQPDATGKVDHVSGFSSVATTAGGKPVAIAAKDLKQVVRTATGWKEPDDLLGDPAGQPLLEAAMHYKVMAEAIRWNVEDVETFTVAADGTRVGDLPAKAALAAVGPTANGKKVAAAKGTVTVTLAADGTASKIVTHLTATGPAGESLVDRTVTTTIIDVDKTTPDVPAEAKAALGK